MFIVGKEFSTFCSFLTFPEGRQATNTVKPLFNELLGD
jgi:hypothetical protein